jgi:dTDP-4-amino-4,6-dideoxy-D-glucose acyltransferase
MIDKEVFILRPEMVEIALTARVDRWIKIEGGEGVTIGEHVHIASFSHINAGGGRVEFGDYSGCSSHVVICGGMPDLDYLHISAADEPHNQHPLRMKTVIGRHVVIFANATICPGVTLNDCCVVGAGAVVTKDIPAGEIWAGNPARKIGERRSLIGADEYWALAQGVMPR